MHTMLGFFTAALARQLLLLAGCPYSALLPRPNLGIECLPVPLNTEDASCLDMSGLLSFCVQEANRSFQVPLWPTASTLAPC